MKYCSNCGVQVDEKAVLCTNCGSNPNKTPVGKSEKFCTNCGESIDINAEICVKCGVRQRSGPSIADVRNATSGDKNPIIALILTLLVLPLGYIYLGKWKKGLVVTVAAIVIALIVRITLISLIIDVVCAYDVYMIAKGEPGVTAFLNDTIGEE